MTEPMRRLLEDHDFVKKYEYRLLLEHAEGLYSGSKPFNKECTPQENFRRCFGPFYGGSLQDVMRCSLCGVHESRHKKLLPL